MGVLLLRDRKSFKYIPIDANILLIIDVEYGYNTVGASIRGTDHKTQEKIIAYSC